MFLLSINMRPNISKKKYILKTNPDFKVRSETQITPDVYALEKIN